MLLNLEERLGLIQFFLHLISPYFFLSLVCVHMAASQEGITEQYSYRRLI